MNKRKPNNTKKLDHPDLKYWQLYRQSRLRELYEEKTDIA